MGRRRGGRAEKRTTADATVCGGEEASDGCRGAAQWGVGHRAPKEARQDSGCEAGDLAEPAEVEAITAGSSGDEGMDGWIRR